MVADLSRRALGTDHADYLTCSPRWYVRTSWAPYFISVRGGARGAAAALTFLGIGQRETRSIEVLVCYLGSLFHLPLRNYDELRVIFKNLSVTDPR
jgi:hypothetical protein